jgi:hypothetical protein
MIAKMTYITSVSEQDTTKHTENYWTKPGKWERERKNSGGGYTDFSTVYLQVKYQGKTPPSNYEQTQTMKDRNIEQVMLRGGY